MTEKSNTGSQWDANWLSRNRNDADNIVLFSKGAPKNIIQFWQRCYYNDMKKLLPADKNVKLLELGCGRATTSMYLSSDNFQDITLLDFSPKALVLASENFAKAGLKTPATVCADAADTKLEQGHYDSIYNVGLLEHFADPSKVVAESYRILRKGGFIFMPIVPANPYRKSLLNRMLLTPFSVAGMMLSKPFKRAGKKSKPEIQEASEDAHIERTSHGPKVYVDLCKKAGFSKVECVPYNPYWKVNRSRFFETKITLPLYKLHYNLFLKNRKVSLECSSKRNICLLLVAYK